MPSTPTRFRSAAALFLGALCLGGLSTAHAALSPCKFNFGAGWNGLNANYPAAADYITIWAGADEDWNTYWIGDMVKSTRPGGKAAGKTPVFYSYFIAYTARHDAGLQDCNVGTPDLCHKGANFIRQQKSRILSQITKYASEAAKIVGSDPIVWLMEPDYYQYAQPGSAQEGGPLTFAEAGSFMKEMVATVRQSLPGAVFSLDISPWINDAAGWYGAFNMGDFTYINTSGGATDANSSKIRNANPMTWKSVHDLTHKPIIADDGYGVQGTPTFHDDTWDDVNNLKARIADGVVAISQANPKADWNSTLTSVQGQLPKPECTTAIGLVQPMAPRSFGILRWDALGRPQSLSRKLPTLILSR
ncbi:MAG: hypothetical protein JF616_12235 [Fibrobacteres bacterium]|jgi:hypothetical protein|nr:hypothetical protein [Fibrobacterota bacterium]